ncbi:unnamed protein product [Protopolystoma xenopodis]|uniref:Uncharacterized protein n=1 Tax=Protopolystoma xenopodis TaxID=117903 RepID=A0A3S4ZV38_9PLAT|nr:unnamed protein product [Protopolystoma xenopodis]
MWSVGGGGRLTSEQADKWRRTEARGRAGRAERAAVCRVGLMCAAESTSGQGSRACYRWLAADGGAECRLLIGRLRIASTPAHSSVDLSVRDSLAGIIRYVCPVPGRLSALLACTLPAYPRAYLPARRASVDGQISPISGLSIRGPSEPIAQTRRLRSAAGRRLAQPVGSSDESTSAWLLAPRLDHLFIRPDDGVRPEGVESRRLIRLLWPRVPSQMGTRGRPERGGNALKPTQDQTKLS